MFSGIWLWREKSKWPLHKFSPLQKKKKKVKFYKKAFLYIYFKALSGRFLPNATYPAYKRNTILLRKLLKHNLLPKIDSKL